MTPKKIESFINDDERKGVLYGSLIAAGINAARGHNIGDALIRGLSGIGQSYMHGIDTLYKEKQMNLEQERLAEMMRMERDKFGMLQKEFGLKQEEHKWKSDEARRKEEEYRHLVQKRLEADKALAKARETMPTGLTPLQKWEYETALGLGEKPNVKPIPKHWVVDRKTGNFLLMDELEIGKTPGVMPLQAWTERLRADKEAKTQSEHDRKLQALMENKIYEQTIKQSDKLRAELDAYQDMGEGIYRHSTNFNKITADVYNEKKAQLKELEAYIAAHRKKYGIPIPEAPKQPTTNRDVTPLVNYFLENSGKFPIKTLVQTVREGRRWSEEEINEALNKLRTAEQQAYREELKRRGLLK